MNDTKSLQWFLSGHIEDVIWHCHEPPVEKLLSIICTMDLNSKILLDSISKCINIMEVSEFLATIYIIFFYIC